MAFRERIELVIDVVTGKSSGGLSKLKSDLSEADGAFAKLKVGGGAAFDFLKQNAAGFAAAGATALAGFAVKAVGDFQKVALGAGKLRDALGVSAEEGSRLQEVAGDLGIGVDALASSMGRMNKAAATTPAAFQAIGAEIAKNRDGTVNVTQTFLNVIDALNRIPDATKRAAAAQQIFGKGWQSMAELISMGAEGVREAMDSVESAKVVDDKQIAEARKFRDAMDELRGILESVSLTVGSSLTPALSEAAANLAALQGPLTAAYEGFNKITNLPLAKQIYENVAPWEQFGTRIRQAGDALDFVRGKSDDIHGSLVLTAEDFAAAAESTDLFGRKGWDVVDAYHNVGAESAAAREAVDELATSQGIAADQAERQRDREQALAESLSGMASAGRDLADANAEAADAFTNLGQQLDGYDQAVQDAKGDQFKLNDVVARGRDAAVANADAQAQVASKQAEVNGQTLTGSARLDVWNGNMLRAAASARGPLRDAILAYIGSVNNIPPERLSEIRALIDSGSVSNAESRLQTTSRSRTSLVNAEAITGGAESALNNLARTRNAQINVRIVESGGAGYGGLTGPRHVGGPVTDSRQGYIIGRPGAEEAWWPDNFTQRTGRITSTEDTKRVIAERTQTGPIVNIENMNVADGTDLEAHLARSAWRASAIPVPGRRR